MVMGEGVSKRLRGGVRRKLSPRRHTALLVVIVALFAARPLVGEAKIGEIVFSFALVVLLLVALYAITVDELIGEREALLHQKRRRSVVGWALALLTFLERLAVMIEPNRRLYLFSSISWLLFIAYVTWSELRSVLKQREVTGETIAMSISVYLLLGLTWGLFYIVIFQLQPNAFSFGGSSNPGSGGPAELQPLFPIFVYFSLTTLSTIGFGDIVPMTLQARYSAVAEGIMGQFYLAILVARLVSLQMSQPRKQ
jgi:hypothetical protein